MSDIKGVGEREEKPRLVGPAIAHARFGLGLGTGYDRSDRPVADSQAFRRLFGDAMASDWVIRECRWDVNVEKRYQ